MVAKSLANIACTPDIVITSNYVSDFIYPASGGNHLPLSIRSCMYAATTNGEPIIRVITANVMTCCMLVRLSPTLDSISDDVLHLGYSRASFVDTLGQVQECCLLCLVCCHVCACFKFRDSPGWVVFKGRCTDHAMMDEQLDWQQGVIFD